MFGRVSEGAEEGAPIGGCWHRKVGGGLTRFVTVCVWGHTGSGNMFGFLLLVLIWKRRKQIGKLAVTDQAQIILG